MTSETFVGYTRDEAVHIDKKSYSDFKDHIAIAQRTIMGDLTKRDLDKDAMVYAAICGMTGSVGMVGPYPIPDTSTKANDLLMNLFSKLARNLRSQSDTSSKMSVRLLERHHGKGLFVVTAAQVGCLVKFFLNNLGETKFPRYFVPLLVVFYDKATRNASYRLVPVMVNSKEQEERERLMKDFADKMDKAKKMREEIIANYDPSGGDDITKWNAESMSSADVQRIKDLINSPEFMNEPLVYKTDDDW